MDACRQHGAELLGVAHVGDELKVPARVTANYERKGHRFVELDALVVALGHRQSPGSRTWRCTGRDRCWERRTRDDLPRPPPICVDVSHVMSVSKEIRVNMMVEVTGWSMPRPAELLPNSPARREAAGVATLKGSRDLYSFLLEQGWDNARQGDT